MPTSRRRAGVTPHAQRGWRDRRNWANALIGPNSHPHKVRRWMKALKIGIGSETGNWPADFLEKAAKRYAKTH